MTMVFRKRNPVVGATPGALVIAPDSPSPQIRVIDYSLEKLEDTRVSSVSELKIAHSKERVTWVDVQGLGDEATIREIGEMFGLHPLAVADVVNIPQRPKAESYGDQLLLIVRMVSSDGNGGVRHEQVSIILGESYVVTFQEQYGDILDPVRNRLQSPSSRLRRLGPDYLAYALLDTIIDGYYPVLETMGDHLEELEADIIANPSNAALSSLHKTKKVLINLRRALWPQREAINDIYRGDESRFFDDEVCLYLRDTYDHCIQTAEVTEMYRELAAGLMNTHLTAIANRTNEIMKALTIMASIFIPLTFVVGVYGMNFEHMPELKYRWSYPLVWAVMAGCVLVMLAFFRRKGWIR